MALVTSLLLTNTEHPPLWSRNLCETFPQLRVVLRTQIHWTVRSVCAHSQFYPEDWPTRSKVPNTLTAAGNMPSEDPTPRRGQFGRRVPEPTVHPTLMN